ncbi:MAG: hypothetical protein SCL54_08410 [Bacillota bacterium]|nr:hypothetical protein [Bacillota bacterium]
MKSHDFLSNNNQYFSEADQKVFCWEKGYQLFAYQRMYTLSNNVDYLHSAMEVFQNNLLKKLIDGNASYRQDLLVKKVDVLYLLGVHYFSIDRQAAVDYLLSAKQIIIKFPKRSLDTHLLDLMCKIEAYVQNNAYAI